MAQEKARPTRARTKKAAGDTTAPKATRKPQARKPAESSADEVARLAYLMWERGEPGDATEHWLRAEAELQAA
jgi:hypothetical protein